MVNHNLEESVSEEALKNIRGASVLVAEDSKINQQIAEELLADIRLQATIVNDGQEAVEAVRHQNFDIVLMDIQMPVMDGFEATKIIREMPQYRHLPIVAMTADADAEDRERCLAAGLSDHVVKSLDPEPLYRALIKWIKPDHRAGVQAHKIPGSQETALPDNLPGIDLSIGLKIVRGNTELVCKLLLDFYSEHHTDIQTIHQAIKNDNDTLAKRIVHTLISTAGSIGAVELHGAAYQLDQKLKENDRKILVDDITELEEVFIPVMNGLREFSAAAQSRITGNPTAGVGEQVELDVQAVFKLIDELAALISEFSPDSEIKARELQCLLGYNEIKPESMETLIDQLAAFDFNLAEKTLITLVDILQAQL